MKGAYRVGLDFNPSGDANVNLIKTQVAAQIDFLQPLVDQGDEMGRCASIAQDRLEEAAMWAVKAITKKPR